jgi:hypothetical protein
MRRTTRQQYYGRSSVAGTLNTALGQLSVALREANKPQETNLSRAIEEVAKNLTQAAGWAETYHMKGQRIRKALLKEQENLRRLVAEVKALPVTADEKIAAKQARAKGRQQ